MNASEDDLPIVIAPSVDANAVQRKRVFHSPNRDDVIRNRMLP